MKLAIYNVSMMLKTIDLDQPNWVSAKTHSHNNIEFAPQRHRVSDRNKTHSLKY